MTIRYVYYYILFHPDEGFLSTPFNDDGLFFWLREISVHTVYCIERRPRDRDLIPNFSFPASRKDKTKEKVEAQLGDGLGRRWIVNHEGSLSWSGSISHSRGLVQSSRPNPSFKSQSPVCIDGRPALCLSCLSGLSGAHLSVRSEQAVAAESGCVCCGSFSVSFFTLPYAFFFFFFEAERHLHSRLEAAAASPETLTQQSIIDNLDPAEAARLSKVRNIGIAVGAGRRLTIEIGSILNSPVHVGTH